MLGGFDRGSFTPFPSLDVKLWKEIRGQGSVFIDYNKRAYSVEEPSEDFRDLAHSEKTEPFPRASSTIQLRDIRTLSLFNFWQSLSRHQPGWQICHYTTSATSTGLISSFFGVFFFRRTEWFPLPVSVRSTEEFSLSLILFQIHFCIWKESTSVKTNMKSTHCPL